MESLDLLDQPRGHRVGDACCAVHRPKSVIWPRQPIKLRNKAGATLMSTLMRVHGCHADPVNMIRQYQSKWAAVRAPGERAHTALRSEVHLQMRVKEEPAKRKASLVPNTYVPPTDNKRLPLRWAVRNHLNHMQ